MRRAALICIAVLALTVVVHAQDSSACKFPVNLERLAAKASEVVDVTMDENLLKFAGNFLNQKTADEAQAKKLLSNIRSLCVRSFEFDQEMQYAEEDVEALRSQLRAPTWSRMVGVRSKRDKENVDVYFRMEKGNVTGLAVIAVEPKELTFVHIDGMIDPKMLSQLGGQFGIPKVEMTPEAKPAAKAVSE
ncbi:MAG: DUF4252 domain-containing protein [Acidobacteria bacterium]|nr:DUF4252 domain-containing protein [Acidobacteriota bacterium]